MTCGVLSALRLSTKTTSSTTLMMDSVEAAKNSSPSRTRIRAEMVLGLSAQRAAQRAERHCEPRELLNARRRWSILFGRGRERVFESRFQTRTKNSKRIPDDLRRTTASQRVSRLRPGWTILATG